MNQQSLTVGIITCARPQKIAACLESVHTHAGPDTKVVVLDSSLNDESRKVYSKYSGLRLLGFSEPISPAGARHLLVQEIDTSILLLLDDDILLTPNTIEALSHRLNQFPRPDIVSAVWKEKSGYRELAQTFHQALDQNGSAIFKRFIERENCLKMGLRSVQADGLHATMMAASSIFKTVNFDPEYDFYLELFDFFMQCKTQGLSCEAVTDTFFWHLPTAYRRNTKRQVSLQSQGIDLFTRKWGMRPLGPLSRNSSNNSLTSRLKTIKSNFLNQTSCI